MPVCYGEVKLGKKQSPPPDMHLSFSAYGFTPGFYYQFIAETAVPVSIVLKPLFMAGNSWLLTT